MDSIIKKHKILLGNKSINYVTYYDYNYGYVKGLIVDIFQFEIKVKTENGTKLISNDLIKEFRQKCNKYIMQNKILEEGDPIFIISIDGSYERKAEFIKINNKNSIIVQYENINEPIPIEMVEFYHYIADLVEYL